MFISPQSPTTSTLKLTSVQAFHVILNQLNNYMSPSFVIAATIYDYNYYVLLCETGGCQTELPILGLIKFFWFWDTISCVAYFRDCHHHSTIISRHHHSIQYTTGATVPGDSPGACHQAAVKMHSMSMQLILSFHYNDIPKTIIFL